MILALGLALILAAFVLLLGVGAVMEGGWHKFVASVKEGWQRGHL